MNYADDFIAFEACFERLLRLSLNFAPKGEHQRDVKSEYFDALKAYPIHAIQAATEKLRDTCSTWPKIPDWIAAMPSVGAVSNLPEATAEELAELEQAERWVYNWPELCKCRECVQADCHMPPRYVPREDSHGVLVERQHASRPSRPVILGKYLHGMELKRWYAARAQFFALQEQIGANGMPERKVNLQLVGKAITEGE